MNVKISNYLFKLKKQMKIYIEFIYYSSFLNKLLEPRKISKNSKNGSEQRNGRTKVVRICKDFVDRN